MSTEDIDTTTLVAGICNFLQQRLADGIPFTFGQIQKATGAPGKLIDEVWREHFSLTFTCDDGFFSPSESRSPTPVSSPSDIFYDFDNRPRVPPWRSFPSDKPIGKGPDYEKDQGSYGAHLEES